MDLYKFGIKIFAANPAVVKPADFIPVFQNWIQEQSIPGHLLIDVHDYSHVHHGPGILLVAHEGNFSMDAEEGRLGLVYYRKQPGPGDRAAQLRGTVQTAREACRLLARDARLNQLTFRDDEFRVIVNDQLLGPNTADTRSVLEPVVARVFAEEFPGRNVTIAPAATDARERFALTVRV